jgi:hypothetical protein
VRLIHAGNRPFKTPHEAALEITRISGCDTKAWQVSGAIMWNKCLVNGVPVAFRETPEAGALLRYPRGHTPLDRGICRAET